MKFLISIIIIIFSGLLMASSPTLSRIKEISKMLANKPVFPAPSIQDRKAWEMLAKQSYIQGAVRLAKEPKRAKLPQMTDELYLEFSKNGNRTHWQNVNGKYMGRLCVISLTECVENKGAYLPEIEKLIKHFCNKRTWVMPAHDQSLRNFNGKEVDIDLGSAMFAWDLATIDAMLNDNLKPSIRKLIHGNLEKRIYTPFEEMMNSNRKKNWWLTTTNNWNAVCLAGVVGSAMQVIQAPDRRAFFIASAEQYIKNFLKGFTPDGNCSEGMGYWNYGYGHFIMLAETIARSTDGKVLLMDDLQAFRPALYGFKSKIQDGVYPAFADCQVNSKPSGVLQLYINEYYGLEIPDIKGEKINPGGSLYSFMLFAFSEKLAKSKKGKVEFLPDMLRSLFYDAGVYIGRKDSAESNKLAMACKAGHNNEHHNHNDVGTYIVVVDNQVVLCDPGGEVYTSRTFSKDRYKSKVLSSYGHPVPLLAGKMQRTGKEWKGSILKKSFTKEIDIVTFDLKGAYNLASLKKFEREFVYSRKEQGSLRITDTVEFDKPQSYENALITFGNWIKNKDGSLFVYNQDKAVNIIFDAGDESCEIRSEVLDEDVHAKTQPIRIGFKLKKPISSVKFAFTIRPSEVQKSGNLLKNGNLEHYGFAWDIPRPGMGEISDKQAFDGKYSLKITDKSKKYGSNISSVNFPITRAGKYVIEGKYLPVLGKGLGIYMKFYDIDDKLLNIKNEKGHIAPVGTLGGKSNKWETFSFDFIAPKGAKSVELWIHSFTSSQVEGYLDEMKIRAYSSGWYTRWKIK